MVKIPLTIRIEELELEYLKEYCLQTGRTQTDVLREYIRTIPAKIKRLRAQDINPLDLPSVNFEQKYLLPEISGIYFVVDGEKNIIYIGRATNIKKRWMNHHQMNNCSDCKIHWMEVKGKTQLKLEHQYITKFRPKLNKFPLSEPSFFN